MDLRNQDGHSLPLSEKCLYGTGQSTFVITTRSPNNTLLSQGFS